MRSGERTDHNKHHLENTTKSQKFSLMLEHEDYDEYFVPVVVKCIGDPKRFSPLFLNFVYIFCFVPILGLTSFFLMME